MARDLPGGRGGGHSRAAQPGLGGSRGDGTVAPRADDRRRGARHFAGGTASRSPIPAISAPKRGGGNCSASSTSGHREPRGYGTVGAVARDRERQSRRRDLDRRDDRQSPRAGRRQPDHRRRHLCRQCDLRGLGDGHGEFFIRYGAAFEIAARLRHAGQSLEAAARAVVDALAAAGGSGGVVAVDRTGALALPFSTAGMYRGYVRDGGALRTAIYDEPYQTGSS